MWTPGASVTNLDRMPDSAPAAAHRASDAERDAAADRLRAAAAEGRLDADELDERVGQVYAARTRGELATLTSDLPEPAAAPPPPEPAWKAEAVRQRLAGFIIANVVCNGVWLATGADSDWWPKWVLLGTGIAVVAALVHAIFGVEEEKTRLPRPPTPPGLPRP
jgi:uncharacterized protein DUF1707